MKQKITNKNETNFEAVNINVINTTTLQLSPNQQNQGFQRTFSNVFYPIELSKENIKALLVKHNNPQSENDKFITKCSKFLKFLFNKQCTNFDSDQIYERLDSNTIGDKLGKNKERTPNYYPYIFESLCEIGLLEIKHDHIRTKNKTGECKGYRVLLQNYELYEENDLDDLFPIESWDIDNDDYLVKLNQIKLDESKFLFIANLLPFDEKKRVFFIYHNWIAGKHFIKIDRNLRIHSLLTILDKKFRCCFTINGEPIHEVDMHACQPFLFLKIVQDQLNHREPIKLSIQQYADIHQEINTYLKWIQSGRFYMEFYKLFHKRKSDQNNQDKIHSFKKMLFKNLFFSDTPDPLSQKKIHKVFETHFPLMNKCMIKFKKKMGYKEFSCYLQQLESEIMNNCIDKLNTDHPYEYYLRYHDAILTTKDFSEQLKSYLNDSINEIMKVDGYIKAGNLWGNDFESVVKGLKLPIYTTHLNNKKNKYIRNLKSLDIRKNVVNVASDEKEKAIQQVIQNWNSKANYEQRIKPIEQNFIFKGFYIPTHWSKITIEKFKKLATLTINDGINSKIIEMNGIPKWSFEYNRNFILDKINAIR